MLKRSARLIFARTTQLGRCARRYRAAAPLPGSAGARARSEGYAGPTGPDCKRWAAFGRRTDHPKAAAMTEKRHGSPADSETPQKRTKASKKKKKSDPATLLRRQIDEAARERDVHKAIEAFDQARRDGLSLGLHSCHVVLNLCAGGETWADNVQIAAGGEEEPGCSVDAGLCLKVQEIHEYIEERGLDMIEFTYTGLARIASICGDHQKAWSLARDCLGKGGSAKHKPRLRTFTPALVGFCKSGHIETALEVESEIRRADLELTECEFRVMLEAAGRAGRVEIGRYVLDSMLREVPEVSSSTADAVCRYFQDAKAEGDGGGYLIERSSVNSAGVCSCCSTTLQALDLQALEFEVFAEKILSLASERERRENDFKMFQSWLRRHGPFDTVIDGANVGFYGQAKEGIFNFDQIKQLMAKLTEAWPERKPLVVLHNRRVSDYASLQGTKEFIETYRDMKWLYATPSGSNDDWYWLYATVLAGSRGLLVTNDEMRDHIFQILSPKYVHKWKDRHQVHFEVSHEGDVTLFEPRSFTRCIQNAGDTWHFPISDSEGQWLCVRPDKGQRA